jgi:hypothetical protein
MEEVIVGPMQIANGLVSLIAAALLAGLILNPRVNEGLIVKLGLIAMTWGLIGTAYLTLFASHNWEAVWNAGLLLRIGLCVVCAGMWWRARKC